MKQVIQLEHLSNVVEKEDTVETVEHNGKSVPILLFLCITLKHRVE